MKRPLLSMINIRNVVSSFHLIAMILVPFSSTFAADDYVADYSYMRGKIEVQEFGRLHRSSSIVMRADPHGLLESPPNITPLDVTFWVRKDPEKGISTILTYPTYDEYLDRWKYTWSVVYWSKERQPVGSTWSGYGAWPKTIIQGEDGTRHGLQLTHGKNAEGEYEIEFKVYGSISPAFAPDDYDLYALAKLHLDKYGQAWEIHKRQITNKKRLVQIISILQQDYKGQVVATRAEMQLKMGTSREQIMQFFVETRVGNPSYIFKFRVKKTILRANTLLYENQWAHYRW